MAKKEPNKSTDPLNDLLPGQIRRKDGDILKKIVVSDWGIDYTFDNPKNEGYLTCCIKKFCKTAEQLDRMQKGAIYRELRGTGTCFGDINGGGPDEIVIVQCGSATREDMKDYFPQFNVTWTESFHTLQEATKLIDLPNLMWDNGGVCFYDCIGTDDEQFDGMDNDDIATYLVTSLDRKELLYAIRHQCLIPKDELIKKVLEYYKYTATGYDLIQVADIDRITKHALSMRERGVEVVDDRDKED